MPDPSGPGNDAEGPFPIDPVDLLRHAGAIANALPGRGDTDYRRAVSAAYYALYHALTLRAATVRAPSGRYDAVRRFRHRHLRNLARTVIHGNAGDARAVGIAWSIRFLRAERERADYDHLAHFTQDRARRAIAIAVRAVEALEDGGGMAFLRLMPAAP